MPAMRARTHGRFGFDDYIDHIIQWLEKMGPGTHVVAVCQPCVQVLAAAAVMAEARNPAQPRSMTLMAGPIDTRINPTKVNELATSKPIEWFENNLIAEVPARYPGARAQGLSGLRAARRLHVDEHRPAPQGAHGAVRATWPRASWRRRRSTKDFYDEYFAVLDLTAEFYLETVQWVFQEARLAKGELTYRGRRVDPTAIRRTALLTVEGERDDICAIGQTVGRARPVQGPQALHEAPPHAGRRRPLRRVQRQALGDAGLSDRAQHDACERVGKAPLSPFAGSGNEKFHT